MDRERLDRWCEWGLLGLICLILGLAPFMYGSTRLIDFARVEALTVCAVFLWTIRFWIRRDYRILWPPIAWTILAFVAYAGWRYSTADIEYYARADFNRIVVYATLFFLILDNFNKQEWTQVLVSALIFVGMAAAMYAIYQFATGSRIVLGAPQPAAYYGRAGGPFICPNHLADYIAMTLPLAFAIVLLARVNVLLKVFLCYAAIVMLGGAFVTLSRGGIISLSIGLLILFTILLFNRDTRLKAIIAIALILIPAVWVGSNSIKAQHRMNKGFDKQGKFAGDDRMYLWKAAKEMWRENFWTGVGPNHFDERFRQLRPQLAQLQVRPDRAHNDYLNTLADYGLIGYALVWAAWAAFWLGVVRIWRFVRRSNDFGSRQSTRSAIILGASAGLLALMVHCIVDFNMHIPALAIVATTLLAIVSGHWRFATERFWIRPGVLGRVAGTIICTGLMAWIGFNSVRSYREQKLVLSSNKLVDTTPEYLARLKQAAAIDPANPLTAQWIGESIRKANWNADNFPTAAAEAISWYDKAAALDKWSPYAPMAKGMCLDWLDRPQEAWPYFQRMLLLDYNSYYTRAHYGWHLLQLGDLRHSEEWFVKSLNVLPTASNPMAASYYNIVHRKLIEAGFPIQLSTPLPAEEQPSTTSTKTNQGNP